MRLRTSTSTMMVVAAAAATPMLLSGGSDSASAKATSQSTSKTSRIILPTWKTFTTATGRGTKIVVSTGGNITAFAGPNQPGATYEHIGVGAIGEGYVLCYGAVNAYDLGDTASGFAAPTTTQTAVTRKTTDGKVTLTQSFALTPGSQTTPSNFLVKMTLKNNSNAQLAGVVLRRQVDFDIDTGGPQGWAGFLSNHSRTHGTVSAFHDPVEAPAGLESHGISLGLVQTSGTWYTRVTNNILDSTCSPAAAPLAANFVSRGDYGDTLAFNIGTINPGASKTVAVRYLRF